MLSDLDDTIAAIASASDGAARGIVRVSGAHAIQVVTTICAEPSGILSEVHSRPRRVSASIDDLPCDLYIWPTARSYTRSPTVEIHTWGSPPLLQRILGQVCAAGARVALPGEFTLRAFLSGRLDLTQAEAVLGVIDATGETELNTALSQLAGGLSRPLAALRDSLLDLLAELEAGLDFAEEDLQFIAPVELHRRLLLAEGETEQLLQQLQTRSATIDTFRVVLLGRPNVGKSSLFNALLGQQAALVSTTSGTTRDYLSARLDLDGVTIELIDTAGREEKIELNSIAAASQGSAEMQSTQAQLRVLCLAADQAPDAWESAELHRDAQIPLLCVLTKTDMASQQNIESNNLLIKLLPTALPTSSLSGEGLSALRRRLREIALSTQTGQSVASTAARCRESLWLAKNCLQRAASLALPCGHEELIAAEVRVALTELGKVAGTVYTDDVLDRIFSRFCIGK